MYDKVFQMSLTVISEGKLNMHNHPLESSPEMAHLPFPNFIFCTRWKSPVCCAVLCCESYVYVECMHCTITHQLLGGLGMVKKWPLANYL